MKLKNEHTPHFITLLVGMLFFAGLIIFVFVSNKNEKDKSKVTIQSEKITIPGEEPKPDAYPPDAFTVFPSQIRGSFKPSEKITDLTITNTVDKKSIIDLSFISGGKKSSRVEFSDDMFVIDPLSQIYISVFSNKTQPNPNLLGQIFVSARPVLEQDEKEVIKTKDGDVILDPTFSVAIPVEGRVIGPAFKTDFEVLKPELEINDNGDFEPILPIDNRGDIILDFSGEFLLSQNGQVINQSFLDVNQAILPEKKSNLGSQSAWPLFPGVYDLLARLTINGEKITVKKRVSADIENIVPEEPSLPNYAANLLLKTPVVSNNSLETIEYSISNDGAKKITPTLKTEIVKLSGKETVLKTVSEKVALIKPDQQLTGVFPLNDIDFKSSNRYAVKSKLTFKGKVLSENSQDVVFARESSKGEGQINEILFLAIGFMLPLLVLGIALIVLCKKDSKLRQRKIGQLKPEEENTESGIGQEKLIARKKHISSPREKTEKLPAGPDSSVKADPSDGQEARLVAGKTKSKKRKTVKNKRQGRKYKKRKRR